MASPLGTALLGIVVPLDELAQRQRVDLLPLGVEVLYRHAGAEPDAVPGDVLLGHARELGEPEAQVRETGRGKMLTLERGLELRVLAQVAVGERFLDLLRQDEGDLVVQALDLSLELCLELVDHTKAETRRLRDTTPLIVAVALDISAGPNTPMPLKLPTHHELARADRSRLPQQIAPPRRRVARRLAGGRRAIA